MRASQRFLDEARRCFEQAAESSDPVQIKMYAELGQQFLSRAREEFEREMKGGNGGGE